MALPTGVHKRGAVFHIQIKVPSDLKASWPSPFYVQKSLGTEDRAEATVAGHRLWAEATEAFARAQLKPPQTVKLTPALLEVLHERIRHSILKSDDERRFEPSHMATVWQMVEAAFPELGALSSDRAQRHRQIQDAEYVWSRGIARSAARGSTNAGQMAADIEAGLLGFPDRLEICSSATGRFHCQEHTARKKAEDAAVETWLRQHEHSASGDRRVYGIGWEQFEDYDDYEVLSVEV